MAVAKTRISCIAEPHGAAESASAGVLGLAKGQTRYYGPKMEKLWGLQVPGALLTNDGYQFGWVIDITVEVEKSTCTIELVLRGPMMMLAQDS